MIPSLSLMHVIALGGLRYLSIQISARSVRTHPVLIIFHQRDAQQY